MVLGVANMACDCGSHLLLSGHPGIPIPGAGSLDPHIYLSITTSTSGCGCIAALESQGGFLGSEAMGKWETSHRKTIPGLSLLRALLSLTRLQSEVAHCLGLALTWILCCVMTGAGIDGVEEIKRHPFFVTIDWNVSCLPRSPLYTPHGKEREEGMLQLPGAHRAEGMLQLPGARGLSVCTKSLGQTQTTRLWVSMLGTLSTAGSQRGANW